MSDEAEVSEEELSGVHPEIPADLIELHQVIEWQNAVKESEDK